MKIRYAIVEFDEFIFDNFEDSVIIYSHQCRKPIIDLKKYSTTYEGHLFDSRILLSFKKEEMYMAVPTYISELFNNLVPAGGRK